VAKHPGPQAAYKRDGFAGVWKWATGHGYKRWYQAYHWARGRADRLKDGEGFRKAAHAYERKYKKLKHDHDQGHPHTPLVELDGRQVPHWIAKILTDARESGIWSGYVFSGYRSPEYSTSICVGMCGHPTCPGQCAGASSNHSCPPTHTGKYPEGAVDVTDPAGLRAYCRSHNRPLHGGGEQLPNDIPHFSHTGR
jgi:hypothetical protein